MDHFIGAVICLVLTLLSIVASVVTGLPIVLQMLRRG